MTRFTGRHIAYAAVQGMFLLMKMEAWVADDSIFSLQEFFNEIVGLFEEYPNSAWVTSTLAWFDEQVFGAQRASSSSANERAALPQSETQSERLKRIRKECAAREAATSAS